MINCNRIKEKKY